MYYRGRYEAVRAGRSRGHPFTMTAWGWWRAGKPPVSAHQTARGSILAHVAPDAPGRTAVCARGSSHDQRADLDRQAARTGGCYGTPPGVTAGEGVGKVRSGGGPAPA